ncbi:MAG: hypothetical protein IKZ43_01080 [Acidaminococcaceae bacterium]|nr:hypothetical protein [Acidaminococcaceae bacterium]MBR4907595.1 hypothetical protein [Acidaminococcaceae bacterium]
MNNVEENMNMKVEDAKYNESMEALHIVMDFDEKLVMGGLTGKMVTDEDIKKAMQAARRLNEDGLYEFDLTGDIAFMKSVAKFMDTFARM